MPLQIGDILKNRYRIQEVLGEGGMGAVYRALDVNLGVTIALKENLFVTEEYARQFRREATILASLRHTNLPRVTDHFVIEGQGQYLVMDFIDGRDLREWIERDGPVRPQEAFPWFFSICDALTYLHTRTPPILHRDIKPGNIKITPDGQAVLVDFGLAKIVEEHVHTTSGAKAMTPGFSPPEQYGTGPTDARTDVFSLAATLYAVLSGKIPEDALERAMGRMTLTSLGELNVDLPDDEIRTIEKALSVSPDERHQTVAEFAAALRSSAASSGSTVLGAASLSQKPTISSSLPANNKATIMSTPGRAIASQPARAAPVMRSKMEPAAPVRRGWPFLLISLAVVLALGIAVVFSVPSLRERAGEVLGFSNEPEVSETVPAAASMASMSTDTPLPATAAATAIAADVVEGTATDAPEPTATVEPTPEATALGGSSGQVAFASNRSGVPQIYLVNVDRTDLTQLTNLPDGACQPDFSPDGKTLVFISPCAKNTEMYPGSSLVKMSLESLEPDFLPSIPGGGDYDPAWSPDGSRIVFTSLRDGRPQLFIMDPDGNNLTKISEGSVREFQPEWDPLGDILMFTTVRTDYSEIWYMPSAGGDAQPFSTYTGRDDAHAAWTSDGQLVLIERDIGGIPRLVVKRFDDRDRVATQICQQGSRAAQPMAEADWSPDGRYVVVETWPDGVDHEIAVLTSTCSNYVELTDNPGSDFDPVWRP